MTEDDFLTMDEMDLFGTPPQERIDAARRMVGQTVRNDRTGMICKIIEAEDGMISLRNDKVFDRHKAWDAGREIGEVEWESFDAPYIVVWSA